MLSLALALLMAAAPADLDQYLDQIRGRVQSAWKQPAKSESLQATVRFNLDRAGRITDLEIAKSSGRKDFDASVLEAVRSGSPFPPLLSILKRSETREIEMSFKGKSVVVQKPKPPAAQ